MRLKVVSRSQQLRCRITESVCSIRGLKATRVKIPKRFTGHRRCPYSQAERHQIAFKRIRSLGRPSSSAKAWQEENFQRQLTTLQITLQYFTEVQLLGSQIYASRWHPRLKAGPLGGRPWFKILQVEGLRPLQRKRKASFGLLLVSLLFWVFP